MIRDRLESRHVGTGRPVVCPETPWTGTKEDGTWTRGPCETRGVEWYDSRCTIETNLAQVRTKSGPFRVE